MAKAMDRMPTGRPLLSKALASIHLSRWSCNLGEGSAVAIGCSLLVLVSWANMQAGQKFGLVV